MKHIAAAIVVLALPSLAGAQAREPVQVETSHGTRAAPEQALTPARPENSEDVEFLLDALKMSLAEVRLGELAQRRSQRPAVRDYGHALVTDHTQTAAEIERMLMTLNVTAPEASPEDETRHAALAKLSGAEFDEAFARASIAAHERALESYGAETHANPNKQLAEFAAKTRPMLERHLAAANAL
jgi:putative membrane protein